MTQHTDLTNMVLAFKITQVQSTCINAITCMPIREVQSYTGRFSRNSPVLNSIMSRPPVLNLPKSDNKLGKYKQKFIYVPQQSMAFNKNFHEIFDSIKFCGHLLFQNFI